MTAAVLLAALAGVCAVLATWEAIAVADEQRLVRSIRGWLAPAFDAVRSGREPTSPEQRRLTVLGAVSLLGGGWLLAGLWTGVALGAAAPWVGRAVVRMRRRRRAAAVAAGAPVIARVLADALAGGSSVRGALIAAARDGGVSGPAGEELRIASGALDLGERTEDVLAQLARRNAAGQSHGPLDSIVAAVLLQRDAGGDLAALLRDLAAALEQRGRVLADARSATAQARFTALIVTGLPAAGLALGELVQPGSVPALAASPLTAAMVGLALILQAVAFVCVRRIARIGEPW
ncbi:MAG TPA: type II secretion system F family protein [Solirubrobacteraceae bacterium]|nr:type II secretion system F family protein [Solirubrobacteraceae bacterium]